MPAEPTTCYEATLSRLISGGNKIAGGKVGEGRDVHRDVGLFAEDKQLVWEEAPEASKDVWDVGEDLVAKGCRESWGCCRGRVSYKVRKE